jgi:hypothetical protein
MGAVPRVGPLGLKASGKRPITTKIKTETSVGPDRNLVTSISLVTWGMVTSVGDEADGS